MTIWMDGIVKCFICGISVFKSIWPEFLAVAVQKL